MTVFNTFHDNSSKFEKILSNLGKQLEKIEQSRVEPAKNDIMSSSRRVAVKFFRQDLDQSACKVGLTCVMTTTRDLFELTFGKRHILLAISQISVVPKSFSFPKLNAS